MPVSMAEQIKRKNARSPIREELQRVNLMVEIFFLQIQRIGNINFLDLVKCCGFHG
jgi:hypothetical protein